MAGTRAGSRNGCENLYQRLFGTPNYSFACRQNYTNGNVPPPGNQQPLNIYIYNNGQADQQAQASDTPAQAAQPVSASGTQTVQYGSGSGTQTAQYGSGSGAQAAQPVSGSGTQTTQYGSGSGVQTALPASASGTQATQYGSVSNTRSQATVQPSMSNDLWELINKPPATTASQTQTVPVSQVVKTQTQGANSANDTRTVSETRTESTWTYVIIDAPPKTPRPSVTVNNEP